MAKDKYVRFDWAAKRMLRNKAGLPELMCFAPKFFPFSFCPYRIIC